MLTIALRILWLGYGLIWLLSMPGIWPGVALGDTLNDAGPGDMIIFDLAIESPAIQRELIFLRWQQGASSIALPLDIVADGRTHRYGVPVGAHPAWRGTITDIRLDVLRHGERRIEIGHWQHVRRPPWALDMALAHVVSAISPTFPAWPVLLLITLCLALSPVVLVFRPRSDSQAHPVAQLGVLLIATAAIVGVTGQLSVTLHLWQRLAALDEAAAQRHVPSYREPAGVNQALLAAAQQLPAGPVLLLDSDSRSYLVYRGRYVLKPRRVGVAESDRINPAQLAALLKTGDYQSLIVRPPRGSSPALGWQRTSDDAAAFEIWQYVEESGVRSQESEVRHSPGLWQLAIALGLTLLAGYALARALGQAAAWAWPFGCGVVIALMLVLDALGIGWSFHAIGIGVALSAALGFISQLHISAPPAALGSRFSVLGSVLSALGSVLPALRSPLCALGSRFSVLGSRFSALGGIFFVALTLLLAVQAYLLPFADQDSWRIWALRAASFAREGSLAASDAALAPSELQAYPPGHSLTLAWALVALGGVYERWAKLLLPLWYLALLLIVWAQLGRWASARSAACWTLLLASTPLLLDHATIGNADLPLACALAMAAVALSNYCLGGRSADFVAGMLAVVLAASIKSDGLYLGVVMLGLASVIAEIGGVGQREQAPYRRQRRTLLLGAILIGGVLALLTLLRDPRGPAEGLAALPDLLRLRANDTLSELLAATVFSANNSARGLLGGGFGLFWIVCGGAIVLRYAIILRDQACRFLLLSLIAGIALYGVQVLLHPPSASSLDRYLLHLMPLAILAAARGEALKKKTRERDKHTPRSVDAPVAD